MTRIDKLFAKLLENPRATISFRDFEKLLKAFGFEHDRTKGSRKLWVHPDVPKIMNVQVDGKDAKSYQVREFLELVEEHGLYM